MSGVFAKIKQRTTEYAGKKAADQLLRGQAYECYKFTQRKSDYIDKKSNEYPMTLVSYIKDPNNGNKYYITMPALYNNLSAEDVQQLNEQVDQKKAPFVVFYGKDGVRNDIMLHEFGDEIDKDKLQSYCKPEDDDESPTKRRKLAGGSSVSDSTCVG